MATAARNLAKSFIDPAALQDFLANRIITPPKSDGRLRPIGIGEVPRRIISKAILSVIKEDILNDIGLHNLCAGQTAAIESIIHWINAKFAEHASEAILLADGDNAFQRLNRRVTLHNTRLICPVIYPSLINFYRSPVMQYVRTTNGQIHNIPSREGVVQGCVFAMCMYAIGLLPLVKKLDAMNTSSTKPKQVWYADDAQAVGKLDSLKSFLDALSLHGPIYGYHLNISKTILCIKDNDAINARATDIFQDDIQQGLKIQLGATDLGAAIGTPTFIQDLLQNKCSKLLDQLDRLCLIAKTQPHAAYTGYTLGLQHKLTFLMRTNPSLSLHLQQLEDKLTQSFLPTLLNEEDRPLSDFDRQLYSLPAKLGGLAIRNPVKVAGPAFMTPS